MTDPDLNLGTSMKQAQNVAELNQKKNPKKVLDR